MDASYIKPFIQSIQNVFSTMLQLPVTVNAPRIKETDSPSFDVSGIIGMSGDAAGSVVLSFPKETAERVVSLFCGSPLAVGTADFADAVGELVNMVSGGAKALFPNKKVSISCPSVVIGTGHSIARQSDTPCIVIPCTTDCGDLVIELSIQDRSGAASAATTTATAKA